MEIETKALTRFRPLKKIDFFSADPGLLFFLRSLVSPQEWEGLESKVASFSQKVSGPWDELAEETIRFYNGPRIEHFDSRGNPIDQIWLPPPVRQFRKEVVEAGIFRNDSQVEQFSKVYLLAHLGEASLTCPLACTEGMIRAIEGVGSAFLKKEILPKLRSAETPLAGAQFVTEMDMGSDVGALATKAIPSGDGVWRLQGEKWFCSAVDEFFLVAARPEGAPSGTKGVAIFYVPRTIEGGLNSLRIKRLKDKVGTRELPTAEIDFQGAVAWNIGPVEDGFKNLMNYVLNTSRIMNAAAGCGLMARAFLEAKNYAGQRRAFGKVIGEYPMVCESLEGIEATLAARRALFFQTVVKFDQNPSRDFESDRSLWHRFLINLLKYRTAMGATFCAHEAILLLGGNGTIETFSILPRLYRDSLIIETWEGTHNTLALQIARDGLKFPFREFLDETLRSAAEKAEKTGLRDAADWIRSKWKEQAASLVRLSDPSWVAAEARHLVDALGSLLEVAEFASLVPREDPGGRGRVLLDRYRRLVSCPVL